MSLSERLISWAQNEEMVDAGYTAHGHDCEQAARALDVMRAVCEALDAWERDPDRAGTDLADLAHQAREALALADK